MASGWLVFTMVGCIIIFCGIILAAVILRAAWAQKERDALTSSDLRALEESALLLVEQLKSEADRGIDELDRRCVILRELLTEADKRVDLLRSLNSGLPAFTDETPREVCKLTSELDSNVRRDPDFILQLYSAGMDAAGIAKSTGLDCAEVNLILSLGKLGRN